MFVFHSAINKGFIWWNIGDHPAKNVPNQATAILLLHSDSFLPSLGFSGPVIKRKSCLQNSGTGLTDGLYLWGFVSSLRGFLSTTWVILENGSVFCKANFCTGGWVWEGGHSTGTGNVAQSTFSGLLDMGKGCVKPWRRQSWRWPQPEKVLQPRMFSPEAALVCWGGSWTF